MLYSAQPDTICWNNNAFANKENILLDDLAQKAVSSIFR